MLKKRLIPKLQMQMSSVGDKPKMVLVTTIQFGESVEIGDPVSQAKIYEAQSADELIFVDIDASAQNRGTIAEVVRRATEEIFMPITVGGGVSSLEDFRHLLKNGADKVGVNSSAVDNPSLIGQAAKSFGSQCVVLSIDYRQVADGSYRVFTCGGAKESTLNPIDWAIEGVERGAGELLLTSIDRDGMKHGLDVEMTRKVVDAVSVPVITSGGCGVAEHFVEGFVEGRASAVSAGTYFCFKDENPMQCRAQIHNAGIPIRLNT